MGDSHLFCQAPSVGTAHTLNSALVYPIRMNSIAERLRSLREQRKVSQVDVAVAVEIARSTLSKYETGGDIPGRDTLMKLAQFYGVTVDWLAASAGDMLDREAGTAKTEQEALMLWAFRSLPADEASAHLNLLISRAKKSKPSS